jgi:hypothetical protein
VRKLACAFVPRQLAAADREMAKLPAGDEITGSG